MQQSTDVITLPVVKRWLIFKNKYILCNVPATYITTGLDGLHFWENHSFTEYSLFML